MELRFEFPHRRMTVFSTFYSPLLAFSGEKEGIVIHSTKVIPPNTISALITRPSHRNKRIFFLTSLTVVTHERNDMRCGVSDLTLMTPDLRNGEQIELNDQVRQCQWAVCTLCSPSVRPTRVVLPRCGEDSRNQ